MAHIFTILAVLFILVLMGDIIYNYYFRDVNRHKRHKSEFVLALEIELQNIKVIIMSLTILDTASPVNANVVVVKKKTGVKVDPQPNFLSVSLQDNNPEVFTITQPDATGNPKAVVVTPVADGSGTVAVTASVDFGGGNTKSLSGPTPVTVEPELSLDLEQV